MRVSDPELSFLPIIDREWFTSPAVRWSKEREGQEIHGKVMVMGLRCGPSGPILDMLIHEMAHLIEIDDARAHLFRYGIRTEGADVSWTPTKRECRVAGIQNVIRQAVGLPRQSWRELVHSFAVLPGFFLTPGKTDRERRAWCARAAAREARKWSPEKVKAEWTRKLSVVERARGF